MARKPARSRRPAGEGEEDSAVNDREALRRLREHRRMEHAAWQQSLAAHGLLQILGSRSKLMWINFVAGLARGVGFFLGVSLLGGLFLGLTALAFDKAAYTLGYHDVSLKQVVHAAFFKFQEIQDYLTEAQQLAKQKAAEDKALSPVQGTGLRPELYRPPPHKLVLPVPPEPSETVRPPDDG